MTRSPRILLAALLAGSAALSSVSFADVVTLKNGDKLNGTVGQIAGGKMEFKSPVLGDITIDMANVESYTTDAPATIRMKGPTTTPVVTDKITSGDATKVQTESGETFTLDRVKVINPPKEAWTGAILATAALARGNTDTFDVGIRAEASLRRASDYADDRINLGAAYNFGSTGRGDNSSTTTDNWMGVAQYDKFWTQKLYGYAKFRVDHDRIASLNYRLAPGVGLGYQWFEGPKANFNTEAGISYVFEDYDPGDQNDYIAFRLAYHYDRKLAENVLFFNNFEILPAFEDPGDYTMTTDIGLRVDVVKNFFTEGRIEWKRDSEPAPGSQKNDLRYIIGVGWRF